MLLANFLAAIFHHPHFHTIIETRRAKQMRFFTVDVQFSPRKHQIYVIDYSLRIRIELKLINQTAQNFGLSKSIFSKIKAKRSTAKTILN